jgi:tripartite-type tricarboxylate transporter receptor subunit TctC
MSASRRILLALCCALLPVAPHAQTWPAKPVKFIVPYPPGGTVDPLARLLGAKLQEPLGQPFVVENRPGAGGLVGTGVAAKAAPDGYTFLFVFDNHAVNPALVANVPFDTLKDFAPVMLVGTAPYAIAAHPSRPFRSFAEVVQAAKAKPEAISIGSIGNGTLAHLTIALAQQSGGFRINHIPYKGGGPMTQDLIGGQVDLGIGSAALLTPHVRGGKVRALATTGEKRAHTLPDVPTLLEQGIPGVTVYAWWGILAPAGTPEPIVARFHAELAKALALPDVRKHLTETMGMELVVSSPEALQKWIVNEMQRWGKVVRENGIKAD